MPCTTILAGKACTYNGSTMISRNDDSPGGKFTPKRLCYIRPEDQPRIYTSTISHLTIELPKQPIGYCAVPNADIQAEGIWAASGINEAAVAMTATETITSNPRVLGADPLVIWNPADNTPGGIGEEDMVTLVLPYIHTAREGVRFLGNLLEKYGTYEANGIAFSDQDEIWYMETIGGHHWIARRLPDNAYAVIANQFSLDYFDLEDALHDQHGFMCSADLLDFIQANHLDLNMEGPFNARLAFGSRTNSDHIYDTPRVWAGQRYFNPNTIDWTDLSPESDDLPWCLVPEHKITVEDIKAVLSNTYEGLPWNPYGSDPMHGHYRSIGINRTDFASLLEIRPDVPDAQKGLLWIAFGCNVYNAFIPQYTCVTSFPAWLSNTTMEVTSENAYWQSRILAALADPHHYVCMPYFSRYQLKTGSSAREILNIVDSISHVGSDTLEAANQQIADLFRQESQNLLARILHVTSLAMKNSFSLSDN